MNKIKNVFSDKYSATIIFVFIIIICIIIYYCLYIIETVEQFNKEIQNPGSVFSLRNIIIALMAIMTAIFTFWRNKLTEKQNSLKETEISLNEQAKFPELVSKALTNLDKSNNLNIRMSGIFLLINLSFKDKKGIQSYIDLLFLSYEPFITGLYSKFPSFFNLNKDYYQNHDIDNFTIDPIGKITLKKELLKNDLTNYSDYISYCDNIRFLQSLTTQILKLFKTISEQKGDFVKIDISNKKCFNFNFNNETFKIFDKQISNVLFNYANFNKINDSKFEFKKCAFDGANYSHSIISFSTFISCDYLVTVFKHTIFENCSFSKSIFSSLELHESSFIKCNFICCDFLKIDFCRKNFIECSFDSCYFDNYSTSISSNDSFSFNNSVVFPNIQITK